MGIIGIEGNSEQQLELLQEATAWTVIAETHRALRNGEDIPHDPRDVYSARFRLGQIRGISELEAWHLVGAETT